jgi:excisionase family DNA binding protein
LNAPLGTGWHSNPAAASFWQPSIKCGILRNRAERESACHEERSRIMFPTEGHETPLKRDEVSTGESPLTALEKLGDVLLMLREHDAMPPEMFEAANAGIERPQRAEVIAAFEKLWAEAQEEATNLALDGLISTLQQAVGEKPRRRKQKAAPKLNELPELMSVRQTAGYLRVNPNAVYVAVRNGQIPSVRLVGKQIRIPRSHFERLADSTTPHLAGVTEAQS